jgi:hypothetical protein
LDTPDEFGFISNTEQGLRRVVQDLPFDIQLTASDPESRKLGPNETLHFLNNFKYPEGGVPRSAAPFDT